MDEVDAEISTAAAATEESEELISEITTVDDHDRNGIDEDEVISTVARDEGSEPLIILDHYVCEFGIFKLPPKKRKVAAWIETSSRMQDDQADATIAPPNTPEKRLDIPQTRADMHPSRLEPRPLGIKTKRVAGEWDPAFDCQVSTKTIPFVNSSHFPSSPVRFRDSRSTHAFFTPLKCLTYSTSSTYSSDMDLENATATTSSPRTITFTPRTQSSISEISSSLSPSPSSVSVASALVLSNSGKKIDQTVKKKYVKQVTGRLNDTEIHLASQRGDLVAVKQILDDINSQLVGTLSGVEFDAEVAEIRASMVNEVNENGETALYIAADRGFVEIVKELLTYSSRESLVIKNRSGYDALHIAASQGHHAIVQVLLGYDQSLSRTIGPSNTTPLISAATKGHVEVVNELLSKDSTLVDVSRSNGKNALHLAARQGHFDIVIALLTKDPQLARRNDKKGQTALHMAVKGKSRDVVHALLEADPAIVMLPDKNGNTALHVATRKKRVEIVDELLQLPDSNVNALTRDHKTALDIAEEFPMSEDAQELKDCLARYNAVRANELNQPRDELRKTVAQIKNDVHIQLEQTRRTNKNVSGIAKELRKLHREGINNATNSVTVVAVLFATVAFAAVFTVPGGDDDNGMAVTVDQASFKIFFIFNAISLFTSLAVVVVQITLVRGETKAEKKVVGVINKLMWLASVCTSVAFIASAYIVVGRNNRWAVVFVTVVGGVIMAAVLGTLTYYVVKSKRSQSIRKKRSSRRSGRITSYHHSEFSNSEIENYFAI